MPADDLFEEERTEADASSRGGGAEQNRGSAGGRKAAKSGQSRARSTTTCPRWMFHRPGVYCKECGK